MNAKLCKRLRKGANKMMLELHESDKEKYPIVNRKLMVLPAHERIAAAGGRNITAVNHPQSCRGIYRWLKRNYAASIA